MYPLKLTRRLFELHNCNNTATTSVGTYFHVRLFAPSDRFGQCVKTGSQPSVCAAHTALHPIPRQTINNIPILDTIHLEINRRPIGKPEQIDFEIDNLWWLLDSSIPFLLFYCHIEITDFPSTNCLFLNVLIPSYSNLVHYSVLPINLGSVIKNCSAHNCYTHYYSYYKNSFNLYTVISCSVSMSRR